MESINISKSSSLMALMTAAAILIAPFAAMAESVTVYSTYPGAANVTEVLNDSAPGFASGSVAADGSGKTDFYFTAEQLFGRAVTLGEIDSISYWTKKGDLHTVNPADWYLNIYTKPYSTDVSSAAWYGDRIGAEPYFSENLNAPVTTWNKWSTDGASNKLRFFESTAGAPGANFGSYTDPNWDNFVAGNTLSGTTTGSRELLYISLQTGSAWADGFTGQLDGLTVTLTDNTVGTVNFEAVVPFEASLVINSPAVNQEVTGVVNFSALYTDEDGDDAIAWAVRSGTCLAGGTTVAGNVDTFNTPFTWNGENFSASVDMTALTPGSYCFIANPTEDVGDEDLRETRNFTLVAPEDPEPQNPANKQACMKNGWQDFGFKNQGQCVRFVETGKDSR